MSEETPKQPQETENPEAQQQQTQEAEEPKKTEQSSQPKTEKQENAGAEPMEVSESKDRVWSFSNAFSFNLHK